MVNASSLNHPAKVYPLRVGSAGAVIAEPGWAVIAVIAVPSLDSKVIVTLATDDAVEDELEGIDDVDELEDEEGVELFELELELGVTELELELETTDDGVEEDELDVIDDVDELEDGGRLELEEELEIVINPNTLIAITRTNPIRNHNQKGFLLFLSLSSSSSSL